MVLIFSRNVRNFAEYPLLHFLLSFIYSLSVSDKKERGQIRVKMSSILLIFFLVYHGIVRQNHMAMALNDSVSANAMTLDSLRDSLIRQEDTIIFALIERARFPTNSPAYDHSYAKFPGYSGSLVQFVVRETEALLAKVCVIPPTF